MFSAQFLAETALTSLRDSHRDAAWVARTALDHAMRLGLSEGYSQAMELANRAIAVQDAIAQRIAWLEPEVGKLVAANLTAGGEQHAKPLH
jgi:hypothetical protein